MLIVFDTIIAPEETSDRAEVDDGKIVALSKLLLRIMRSNGCGTTPPRQQRGNAVRIPKLPRYIAGDKRSGRIETGSRVVCTDCLRICIAACIPQHYGSATARRIGGSTRAASCPGRAHVVEPDCASFAMARNVRLLAASDAKVPSATTEPFSSM
jgi:hypothetical protein